MSSYYRIMAATPNRELNLEAAKSAIEDLAYDDVSNSEMRDILDAICGDEDYDITVGEPDPYYYLEAAKSYLRQAVELVGALEPTPVPQMNALDAGFAVIIGEGDLDSGEFLPADAVGLVIACDKVREAIYTQPSVTISKL